MPEIKNIVGRTSNPFLNLYELEVARRDGVCKPYYVASRAREAEGVKAVSHNGRCDGIIIFGIHGEKKDKVVLVRQYRYAIDDYIYEFPAGLVEPGEAQVDAGIREFYEETGLQLVPKVVNSAYEKPFFTSVGMTDECCGTLYGYCQGDPTNIHQEASEDIEIVLADREECKRILKEGKVAIMCAYMLMHFIHCSKEDPLAFLEEI